MLGSSSVTTADVSLIYNNLLIQCNFLNIYYNKSYPPENTISLTSSSNDILTGPQWSYVIKNNSLRYDNITTYTATSP